MTHDVAADARLLTVDDAGELLTLQLAAWVSEAVANQRLDIPTLHETLADVQAQLVDPALTIWGYRPGTRLLATVRTSIVRPGVAFLGRLGVVPDFGRQGLGSAMLHLAESRLPVEVTRSELVTGRQSLTNHAFYARHGYSITGEDVPVGIVFLAKDLE